MNYLTMRVSYRHHHEYTRELKYIYNCKYFTQATGRPHAVQNTSNIIHRPLCRGECVTQLVEIDECIAEVAGALRRQVTRQSSWRGVRWYPE